MIKNITSISPVSIIDYVNATIRYGHYLNHPYLLQFDERLRKYISKRICAFKTCNAFYFRIPKAANSTIINTIASTEGVWKPQSSVDYKTYYNRLPNISLINSSYKFTFARNPYSRVLSAYKDKIAKKSYFSKPSFGLFYKNETPVSFDEFLDLIYENYLYFDIHWAPQCKIVNVDQLDYIGKIESIEIDLTNIFACLSMKFAGLSNVKSHATHADVNQLSIYSKKQIEIIYKDDFETFNY